MTTRHYSANAQPTTLGSDITNSATSITVAATTGFPAVDFVLALDYGTSDQELVLVTNVSGTTLTVTRGLDSTSAVAHSAGAAIRHVHSSSDFALSRTHEDATSGIHGVTGSVVGTTDTQTLTNKTLGSGTVLPATTVSTAGSQTLTNKTIDLTDNTVTGTLAEFNTAVSDANLASLAGSETLTNKTISVDSNTVSGVAATSFVVSNASGNIDGSAAQKAIPSGTVVGTSDSQTLTNKTIDLTDNTLSGTAAEFNTAVSDDDFVTLTGTETLSNKTLSAPTVTGALTGVSAAFSGTVTTGNLPAKITFGTSVITTNGSGGAVFLHGLGSTPDAVFVQVRGTTSGEAYVGTLTSSSIPVTIRDSSGALVTNTEISVMWMAIT